MTDPVLHLWLAEQYAYMAVRIDILEPSPSRYVRSSSVPSDHTVVVQRLYCTPSHEDIQRLLLMLMLC